MKSKKWYVYPHTPEVEKIIFDSPTHCISVEIYDRERRYHLWEVPDFVAKALCYNRFAKGHFTLFVFEDSGDISVFNPREARKILRQTKNEELSLEASDVSATAPT